MKKSEGITPEPCPIDCRHITSECDCDKYDKILEIIDTGHCYLAAKCPACLAATGDGKEQAK